MTSVNKTKISGTNNIFQNSDLYYVQKNVTLQFYEILQSDWNSMWNKIIFGSVIFYMLITPPSVLAQLASFFDDECQVCKEDWFPVPFYSPVLKQGIDSDCNCRIDTEKVKPMLYWIIGPLANDKDELFAESIKKINSCNNPIIIDTSFYDGSGKSIFTALSKIDKKRIIFLLLHIKDKNYVLSQDDINSINSMTNLKKLMLNVKIEPSSHFLDLKGMRNLKKLAYVSNYTEEDSQRFFNAISNHPSIEQLGLSSFHLLDSVKYQFPPHTQNITIALSHLSFNFLKIVGSTNTIRHVFFNYNEKFPVMDHKEFVFHSKIRCLHTFDPDLSKYILHHLDSLSDLRLLHINITPKDFKIVVDQLNKANNIRTIILPSLKNEEWDKVIKEIRSTKSIYIDYASEWGKLNHNHLQHLINKKYLNKEIFDIRN
jgi:hypothetical protein